MRNNRFDTDSKNITERTEDTDREQADNEKNDQRTPTASSKGPVHSPVERGVTQIVRSVPVAAEPLTALTVGPWAPSLPTLVLRAKPTSSFGTIGQAQAHKIRVIGCAFCDTLVLVPLQGGNGGQIIAFGNAKDHHAIACGRKRAISTRERGNIQ